MDLYRLVKTGQGTLKMCEVAGVGGRTPSIIYYEFFYRNLK